MMRPEVLLLTTFPSYNDTNLPLGPALLAQRLKLAGVSCKVPDVNMWFIETAMSVYDTLASNGLIVGDHDKSRDRMDAARSLFRHELTIAMGANVPEPLHVPESGNAISGLHYAPDVVARVGAALTGSPYLRNLMEKTVFDRFGPPRVVGISVMSPIQMWSAVMLATQVHRRWPTTKIALGGTQISMLMRAGQQGPLREAFGGVVDRFFVGHSEDHFALYVLDQRAKATGVHRLTRAKVSLPVEAPFIYLPNFSGFVDIGLYRKPLTIPMQGTRGCPFANCAYCSYPGMEPIDRENPDDVAASRFHAEAAAETIATLMAQLGASIFSFKDSLFTLPAMKALCAVIEKYGLKITWSCTSKLISALADPAIADMLWRNGLRTIEFGLESINPHVQALFGKECDKEVAEAVAYALAGRGITVIFNMIFGAPNQTYADAVAQFEWFRDLRNSMPDAMRPFLRASATALEIERGTPMANPSTAKEGTPLANAYKEGFDPGDVAPLAESYEWPNAPSWVPEFVAEYMKHLNDGLYANDTGRQRGRRPTYAYDQMAI